MKLIKNIGVALFLIALALFSSLIFLGKFQVTEDSMTQALKEKELNNLRVELNSNIVGKTYSNAFSLAHDAMAIFEKKNSEYKANSEWDKIMYDKPRDFALRLTQASENGVSNNSGWWLFFTFGLGIIGALMFMIPDVILLGPAGIKNNHIYHHSSTNRGWIGILTFIFLVTFYILLYMAPYYITNWTLITKPLKAIFMPNEVPSQWFVYGLLYTVVMSTMALRMYIKYRHNMYQIVRTTSVLFFQIIFAFLLVEILPIFGLPGKDLKNAWPLDYYFLFDWNVQDLISSGHFGKFMFIWGIILSAILIPTLVYFYGKRWYCSWVCGCGGLAETLGDPYRQLSNKKLWSWKLERYLIHGVLVFAIIMTAYTGYHSYNEIYNPDMEDKAILLGYSAYDIRDWYGFLIGTIFAGVIGTGFYPVLGNRSWCRFGCPLAAYMGIVQRFKSRFRITTNGGQCISCGNCSTYCEQGIDVRAYAQKGQNIVRASCVGCGVCSAVCPRGVLKLENGPDSNRMEEPTMIIGTQHIHHLSEILEE